MALAKTKRKVQGTEAAAPNARPVYSLEAGKKALERLTPQLDALADEDVTPPRVDVEIATYALLGVTGSLGDPAMKARFAELPASAFDMANVEELGAACAAMLYALHEARTAGALDTEAKIPAAIAAEAAEVEARMQTLCEYHFSDDATVNAELQRLRPGTGYRDLASDLLGYAQIYEQHPEVVKGDPKRYRPGDAARAQQLANEVIQALSAGMTPKARTAYDRYAKVWTIVSRRYDEVRAAALWLFRDDPKRQERFPSLFIAARPGTGRHKNKKGGDNKSGEAPKASSPHAPAESPHAPTGDPS